jgi:protocatechuate 3,4-dioxygenase beta subunit
MTDIWLLMVFFLLSVATSAQDASSDSSKAQKRDLCVVAGTVIRQDTGEPLEKAEVSLEEECEGVCRSSTILTGPDGGFRFEGVPAGTYYFSVSKRLFVTAWYGQRKPSDPWFRLTLQPGQKLTDLVFKLFKTSVITGKIEDENGEPLEGFDVILCVKSRSGGKQELQEIRTSTTNDLGEYRLFDLEPGRYYLEARPADRTLHLMEPLVARLGSDGESRKTYTTTYFPGTSDPEEAAVIVIRSGQGYPALDFAMRKVRGVNIQGRVINAIAGKTDNGVDVTISNRAGRQEMTTTRNGAFTLRNIPPGSYRIGASWSDGEKRFWTTRTLEVGSADVEDVALTITAGIKVSGLVTRDDGRDPVPMDASVSLVGLDDTSFYNEGEMVKSDGSFVLENVYPGVYGVELRLSCADCYMKSVHYGTTDAMEAGFRPNPGSDAQLELVISSRGAHVNCTALDSDSLPVGGSVLLLLPEGPKSIRRTRTQWGRSDQNGRFQFNGVAPGTYTLLAFDNDGDIDFGDVDSLDAFKDKGVKIKTSEGSKEDVELRPIVTSKDTSEPQ